jgi:hypothetical protein
MIFAAGVAVVVFSVSGPGSASLSKATNRYGSIKIGFNGWGVHFGFLLLQVPRQ